MTPKMPSNLCTGAWVRFGARSKAVAYQLVRYDFCLSYLMEIIRQEI